MRARSRGRGIGANVFTSTPTPTCPPGQHWEDPGATAVRGLGACVPNVVALTLHPAAPAAAPPPLPPAIFQTPTTDAAPAPSPGQLVSATCPTPWPLWWLLVAAAAGALAGRYVAKNQKKVKKNAGRIVNAAGGHLVDRGMSRLLG